MSLLSATWLVVGQRSWSVVVVSGQSLWSEVIVVSCCCHWSSVVVVVSHDCDCDHHATSCEHYSEDGKSTGEFDITRGLRSERVCVCIYVCVCACVGLRLRSGCERADEVDGAWTMAQTMRCEAA